MSNAQLRRAFKPFLMPSWLWRGVVCNLLFLFGFVSFVTSQVPLQVEWQEGRLSVIAEQEPLKQVLQEVAKQTGIEVRGMEVLRENVSLSFSRLPLHEGLRRLLAQVNYVIVEEKSPQGATRPAQALILGRLAPSSAATSASEEVAQVVSEPKAETVLPIQDGTPLEDERVAAVRLPAQDGTPLEDERVAAAMISDQGGTPLEDEWVAEAMISDQGGTPLEDERMAAAMISDQDGTPLEDERVAAAMISSK